MTLPLTRHDRENGTPHYHGNRKHERAGWCATVNGCYCLEVKELDGAQKILFENWGTADQQSIQEALRQVEKDNKENARDEWEVLKEVSQQFADLGNGYLILLDENYIPFEKKNYMDATISPSTRKLHPNNMSHLGKRFHQRFPNFKNTLENTILYIVIWMWCQLLLFFFGNYLAASFITRDSIFADCCHTVINQFFPIVLVIDLLQCLPAGGVK